MSWVQQLCSLADTYVSRSHHLHAHARRGAGAPGGYAPCVCWPPRLAGLEPRAEAHTLHGAHARCAAAR